jgi:hypothetical protein
MVFGPRSELPRHSSNGVRRMDNLEASVRYRTKRVLGIDRTRLHGTVSKSRDNFNTVRAWAVLIVVSPSAGAVVAAFTPRGR